ncbi:uncharacterized protein N0V89_011136 [Didymosphaeria variabile]|uniref:FAD-binding domain-containing protein n=1 Tax=Didymosphaeria variabile TaxID=1932322 RepID=A0A9W9C7S4_9PLEO|nr:uncharacterized protein N0V89_011136 [Didymosphaeria variabile]KAJ4347197.1 hypothetical protein N0V89_011136 [Didymosphaeria variabile]
MSSLSILIVGTGIAGPTLALLLQRANPLHHITLIERAPTLRASGLQLDFKAQGTPIMRKMGLLEAMRAHHVNETGAQIVGAKGEVLAAFGIKEDVGTEGGDGVDVTFEDGREERFDLVVGADGQNSRTRKMAFGEEVSAEAFKELGSQVAYFNIPRGAGDGTIARLFFSAKSRAVMARNGGRPMTQVYMFSQSNLEKIKASYGKSVAEQKAVWKETFKGAGWETDRFLEGMQTADDFYAHHIAQVKLPSLYKGRIALVGDAGYCPSVMTGKGTTAAFIGAYLLAGELARKPHDVDAALKSYDEVMKEPVKLAQIIDANLSLPSSSLAVWFIRNGLWAACSLKIDKLVMKLMPQKKEKGTLEGWQLPNYPELNLRE